MSMSEVGLILLVVLVFMGPEKIPDAARTIGKMLREVRKASNLLRDAVLIDVDEKPVRPTPLSEPSGSGTAIADTSAPRDPDPKKDVRIATMSSARGSNGVKAMALQAALAGEASREVYLHVPYDETI